LSGLIRIEWEFPKKLGFLLDPSRYKVAYGGRGGAKSWNFARAVIALGYESKRRILCAREVQLSIKDSVHKLLGEQIEQMGLDAHFEVKKTEIIGANGTEFLFTGLSSQTRESIKSFEGVDIAWVEEAQAVSKRSWDILIPTIRKEGSEIWVSFNPELDTDDTYQRFVVNPPENARVVKVNWSDNPWFPHVLDVERLAMQARDPDSYANIWEGECRPAVEGAIYFGEVSAVRSSGRLANVPHDPLLPVHAVFDLGYDDYMSIVLVQRLASEIRIIRYIEDRRRTLAEYDAELRALPYRYGTFYLPHDGRAKDYRSGKSAEEIMTALGRQVEIVEDIGVEEGIRAARLLFPRCYFDKADAGPLLNRLGRYRRRINKETGTGSTPVHDDESHGADAFRYLAVVADQMNNSTKVDHGDYYKAFRRAG
jgi:phage terminase large subunit